MEPGTINRGLKRTAGRRILLFACRRMKEELGNSLEAALRDSSLECRVSYHQGLQRGVTKKRKKRNNFLEKWKMNYLTGGECSLIAIYLILQVAVFFLDIVFVRRIFIYYICHWLYLGSNFDMLSCHAKI